MPVKTQKQEPEIVTFPEQMESKVRGMFAMQQIASISKGIFDEEKKELEVYLHANKDGIDIKTSEGMPTNYGLITYKKRDGDKVDTDALVKLVKDGVITIESLVGMGSFSASKIKESLPKSAADKVIQSGEPVLYLELRASQEFKNQCQEIVAPMLQDFDVQNTKPVASAEPPVTKKRTKKELAPKEIVKSKKSQSELSKLLGE